MTTSHQRDLHRFECHSHSILGRSTLEEKLAAQCPRTDVREPEKLECLWPALPPLRSLFGGEPSKPNEPSLVGMQLQREQLQTGLQLFQKLHSVGLILEPDDEIVGVANNDYFAA